MQQLNEPSLRINDTSVLLLPAEQGYTSEPGRDRYRKHIPGAGFINLPEDWSDTRSPYNNTVPEIDALAEAIARDGIDNDNPVVLYSSSHIMWATRAWWLLRYAGHTNVKVLNGNFTAWLDAGYPVESGEARYPSASFTPVSIRNVRRHRRDGSGDGEHRLHYQCAIPAVYAGTGDVYYGRRGHIPGSRSIYFSDYCRMNFFTRRAVESNTRGSRCAERTESVDLSWQESRNRRICLLTVDKKTLPFTTVRCRMGCQRGSAPDPVSNLNSWLSLEC